MAKVATLLHNKHHLVFDIRWFGHVERIDDNDWVKRGMTLEVEGIRQRGRPKRPVGIILRMTWKV